MVVKRTNEIIYVELSYKLSHMGYVLQICNITQISNTEV